MSMLNLNDVDAIVDDLLSSLMSLERRELALSMACFCSMMPMS